MLVWSTSKLLCSVTSCSVLWLYHRCWYWLCSLLLWGLQPDFQVMRVFSEKTGQRAVWPVAVFHHFHFHLIFPSPSVGSWLSFLDFLNLGDTSFSVKPFWNSGLIPMGVSDHLSCSVFIFHKWKRGPNSRFSFTLESFCAPQILLLSYAYVINPMTQIWGLVGILSKRANLSYSHLNKMYMFKNVVSICRLKFGG